LHSKLHLPHKEQTQHRKEDLAQDMRGSGRCGAENLENLREWVVGVQWAAVGGGKWRNGHL